MDAQDLDDQRPRARHERLIVEEAAGEKLVYDLERHRVHCLNGLAARIWAMCTGDNTVAQIAAKVELGLNEESRDLVVHDTITDLGRLGLIEGTKKPAAKLSRRELVRKIGIGALAAGVVLPLVTSIVAPTPAYAQSCAGLLQSCGDDRFCCPGRGLNCKGGICTDLKRL
jgi:hypothetical protein